LGWLLRNVDASILLNEHIAEDGPTVFAHACRLGVEGIVSKRRRHLSIRAVPVWIKVRSPASNAVLRERSENWNGNRRSVTGH
jgi:ATP-dependent DNA ligase